MLAAAAFLALAPAARAAGEWTMEKFSSDIEVQADGVLRVEETIGADFLIPRHGIFRYVPYEATDTEGHRVDLSLDLRSVTMDGAGVQVSESTSQGNAVWKIGWPDRTFVGKHEYRLIYVVRGAIGRFKDHDEL